MAKTTEPPSELVVMGRLDRMLGGLDQNARDRVMAWLIGRHCNSAVQRSTTSWAVGLTPPKVEQRDIL